MSQELERLEAMANDTDPRCDLWDEHKQAIQWALAHIQELEQAERQYLATIQGQAESIRVFKGFWHQEQHEHERLGKQVVVLQKQQCASLSIFYNDQLAAKVYALCRDIWGKTEPFPEAWLSAPNDFCPPCPAYWLHQPGGAVQVLVLLFLIQARIPLMVDVFAREETF